MNETEQRAYCPGCHRDSIRTYEESGVRKYRTRDHVEGGGVSCLNSGQPVQAQARQ